MTQCSSASTCASQAHAHRQKGVSLLELMVGMAVGLLVVAAGLGAVLTARALSGTVSEASAMQLQASFAYRIIGQQIRQVGGRMLKPVDDASEFGVFDENPALATYVPIQGQAAPSSNQYALELLYQNTADKSFPLRNGKPQLQPLLRNCIGESTDPGSTPVVLSRFRRQGNDLVCAGTGEPQVLISGVADFQLRYLLQANASSSAPAWLHVDASQLSTTAKWLQVYAIEVCMELVGQERIDTAGATYTRCDKKQAARGDRLRMVFRNTFFINNRVWTSAS